MADPLPTTVETPVGTLTIGPVASITLAHNGHQHTFTDAVITVAMHPYNDNEVRYEVEMTGHEPVGFLADEVIAFTP